jgi:thymidylate kinase
MNSQFIMVDGIDGSGKDTIADGWKDFLVSQGNGLFDVRDYCKKNGRYPEPAELKAYDFIFTNEPTYVGVGKVIREELTRNGTNYSELAIAQAFSLDRLVQYEKIIIPALKDGKCIIQVRGISTSLCYQALSGALPLKILAELPGNALALTHRPDQLVILDIPPKQAVGRLGARSGKQDDAIFERLDFLEKATQGFRNPDYQHLFTSRGTTLHYLPATAEIATMKAQSIEFLSSILK